MLTGYGRVRVSASAEAAISVVRRSANRDRNVILVLAGSKLNAVDQPCRTLRLNIEWEEARRRRRDSVAVVEVG